MYHYCESLLHRKSHSQPKIISYDNEMVLNEN